MTDFKGVKLLVFHIISVNELIMTVVTWPVKENYENAFSYSVF